MRSFQSRCGNFNPDEMAVIRQPKGHETSKFPAAESGIVIEQDGRGFFRRIRPLKSFL